MRCRASAPKPASSRKREHRAKAVDAVLDCARTGETYRAPFALLSVVERERDLDSVGGQRVRRRGPAIRR